MATDEIETDLSRWPLVLVRPPVTVTDAQMQAYLDRFDAEVIRQEEPYGVVLDLRRTKAISPRQRAMLTESMERHDSAALCQGTAMVFESRLLKAILSAIFWVRKPAYPTRVFTDLDEGCLWVQQCVADLPPPDGWLLQGPATRQRDAAKAMARDLDSASVGETQAGHLQLYVCRLGPFSTREAAVERREDLGDAGREFHVVPQPRRRR